MSVLSQKTFVFVGGLFVLGTVLYVLLNKTTDKNNQQKDGFKFPGSIKHDMQVTNHDILPSDCRTRNLTFITKTPHFTMVALLSYPGSGNTWTRHLLQQLTGFYTGSVYINKLLQRNGFPGEQISTRHRTKGCLVYKSHRQNNTDLFDKAIILIRNPFNALKAYYNYRYGVKSVNSTNSFFRVVDKSNFDSSRWLKFTMAESKKWQYSYTSWLKTFENRFLLIKYSDLKRDLTRAMKRISRFLHVRPSKRDYRCTSMNQEGNFHRQQKYDLELSDIYNDKQVEMINDAIRNVMKVAESKYNLMNFLYVK